MKKLYINMLSILALMTAFTVYAQDPGMDHREEVPDAKKWQVQVGWVHQRGRGMSVRGPAPSLLPAYRSRLSGVGLTYSDNSTFIPRTFNDGYVRPDVWTTDEELLNGPASERYGMTWNWGVNSAGQYNYDGGIHPRLSFHIDRGTSVGGVTEVQHQSDGDYRSNGIEVKARRLMHTWIDNRGSTNDALAKTVLELNLVVGMAWFPRVTQHANRSVGQDLYRVRETYTYFDYYGSPAGGSWGPLEVPYAGTFEGPGSLVPARPESSSLKAMRLGTYVDRIAIRSEMWHLRGDIGVELVLPVTERLSVYASPQFVLELVDMDVEWAETVTLTHAGGGRTVVASNSEKRHKTTLVPGILLTAGVDFRFTENWYAGASVGWEELFRDPSLRVGSDKVKYDIDGGEVSLYVGRRF